MKLRRRTGDERVKLIRAICTYSIGRAGKPSQTVAKSAVLRAVTAAEVLMPVLEKEGCSLSEFAEEAEKAVQAAKNMNKKKERQIEQKVKDLGKGRSVVRDPDLLGCDLNYYSSRD